MSGYAAQKIADLNSGQLMGSAQARRFRMGRCTSPEQLAESLGRAIIGQEQAVEAVVRAVTIAAAGIRDPHRPIASLLFVGPTGVGKTELARRLAAEITGDPEKLCRIDMNTLAQEHYAASLSGAPPGYSGAKEQFTLFDRELVEGNLSRPGIVLFDEVEKAHTTVLRSLLQILDSGTLRLTAGNATIDFRNTIVLLTSNLGSAAVAARSRSRTRPWGRRRLADAAVVARAVEDFFDPELYNRFDEVVYFRSLDAAVTAQIVDRELDHLRAHLQQRGIEWSASAELRKLLVATVFSETYGAREVRRVLRARLHAPLAATIVRFDPGPGQRLRLTTTVQGEDIVVTGELVS